VRAWREDLDTAVSVFLPRDRSFSPSERTAFKQGVAALRDSVPALSDQEIAVRLARTVALSKEAHTRAVLLRLYPYFRRYPIRIWGFADGPHVVAARPEHRELLGSKLVAIAGRPVADVARLVEPIHAGNPGWDRYMATYSLTSPDVLLGLNVVRGDGAAEYSFRDARGRLLTSR
jgi:hypothetical protein